MTLIKERNHTPKNINYSTEPTPNARHVDLLSLYIQDH